MTWKSARLIVVAVLLAACTQNTNLVDPVGGMAACEPGGTQCNNCLDDDGDGLTDGFDPHCISSLDDREDSFETGIPGDNNNLDFQDCYFDGNSGHGDDGCRLPTCCMTNPGAPDCPPPNTPPFITCDPTDVCLENCAPAAAPGCDCFGCCTICAGGTCRDVITNPRLAPECDVPVVSDNAKCPACIKSACGVECDPDNCIRCLGQTLEDLPAHCTEPACPPNRTPCLDSSECPTEYYCSVGCCVTNVLQ